MMRAALGVWILSAVVCVGRGHHHEGHHHEGHHHEGYAKAADEPGQDTALNDSVSLVTAANKEFAFNLYKKLAAHASSAGKNIFYSPVSMSLALATLAVGARGETHQQIFRGLGFGESLTQAAVDQAFHTLLASGMSQEDTSEGTAVFVDKNFKPLPEFLDVLKKSYFADGFSIAFNNTTDSMNTINKYVEEKTNGKIDKLVEDLEPSTIMFLISYIYYKGMWANPFNPKLTKEDTFTVDENTKVPVQMMNMEANLDTYYDQDINTSVLHLPFNSSYSMLLLLPDSMEKLENMICSNHITKWLKWMKSRRYDVYVPKFSIKTSVYPKEVLTEMGMTDMFGAQADLSGISEGQKLFVSEIVHQASLDVDEAGATAAAATGIGITLLSFRHIPVLKFNRPFMVLITDRTTENILFMGKIVNPTI